VQPIPIYVNTDQQQVPPPPPNSARAPNGEYVAPLQQQTQTTYVPQSVALSGPRMIKDWEPGQPIPMGYHPETRARTGLIVAGAVTFGTLYLISLFSCAIAGDAARNESNPAAAMCAPVVGPFIQMAQTSSSAGNVALAVDGIAQAAGATMLIVGIASPRNVLVRNDLATVRLTPVPIGGGRLGMGLSASF
jgi:hypothetical protein